MKKDSKKAQRLISLFLIALFLLNFPLLNIFNHPSLIGGIPLLYVYIFGSWLVLIVITALLIGKQNKKSKQHA
jgi:hypothetical protein